MKKLYNKILNFIKLIPILCEKIKHNIFERLKLINDKKVYEKETLTYSEQSVFEEFWKKTYGKKITNKWHLYYKSFTGKFDEKYFPQILYSTNLEFKLNPWYYANILSDKNLMDSLFGDLIVCPKTLAKKCGNHFFGLNGLPISQEDLLSELKNAGKVVFKITVGSSSGQGVRICDITNGVDINTGESLDKILTGYTTDFNIQEFIEQSDALNKIYPNCVNTFRVITYIANNKINCAPISMRFGANGGTVDNIHAGGMTIGVNEDGILNKYAFLEFGEKFTEHPDTHLVFDGYVIPSIDKIIETAQKLHTRVPQLGMISWDFTLNKEDLPVLIEVNLRGQSVCFPQEVHGKSLFGDDTEYMIKLLKKKK